MKKLSLFLAVALVLAAPFVGNAQVVNRVVDQIITTTCSNQFIRSIAASGAATCATVVAASDISGLATSATTDTTNATNIASGTLASARFPAPITSTPTPTCSSGSGTLSSSIEYTQFNKQIQLAGAITVTTVGTCSGGINITLPVAGSGTYGGGGVGQNFSSGKTVTASINPAGPTVVTLFYTDGTGLPAGGASTVGFSITYFAP